LWARGPACGRTWHVGLGTDWHVGDRRGRPGASMCVRVGADLAGGRARRRPSPARGSGWAACAGRRPRRRARDQANAWRPRRRDRVVVRRGPDALAVGGRGLTTDSARLGCRRASRGRGPDGVAARQRGCASRQLSPAVDRGPDRLRPEPAAARAARAAVGDFCCAYGMGQVLCLIRLVSSAIWL